MAASKSFTAVGDGPNLLVRRGQTFAYSVTGTFVGTVVLQQFIAGGWTALATATDVASGTVTSDPPNQDTHGLFRFLCSAFTSGTIVTALTPSTSDVTGTRTTPDGVIVAQTTDDGELLISPMLRTAKGVVHGIETSFTETAGAGVYTASVAVPAGATILDIIVNGVALWNPATSATLKVGDVADDDGYFTGVDLKATDLLAGESISFDLAGGKAGAYIANSQVSPRYSASARVVSGIVTTVGGSGTTGRTRMTVFYHLPVSADITAATKV